MLRLVCAFVVRNLLRRGPLHVIRFLKYVFIYVTAKEDSDMKEIAIDATTRLKQAVTNEREVKLRLKEENEQLKVCG